MRSKILALVSAFAAFLAVMVGLFGSPATASASPAVTDSVTINQMVTLSNSVEESKFSVSASDSSYFTASCVFSWTGPVSGHSPTIVIDSMAGGSTISGNLPDGNYTGTVTCTASNVSGSFLATAPFTIGTATPSATPTPTVITEPAPTVTLDSQGNLKVTGKAPGVEGYKTVVYLLLNGEADAYTYAINPGSSYTLVDLLVVGRPTQVQVVAKVADVSYTGPGASTIVYDQTLTALAPSTTPSAPSWTTGTWNHKNGAENLPCSSQVHWVLHGKGISAAQVKVGSGDWANMAQNGEGSFGYTYPGAVTTNTVVQYRYSGVPTTKVVFTLSDCSTASPTPSASVTPSAPVTSLPPAPSASETTPSVAPTTSVTTPAQHLTSATTPAVVHTTTSVEQSAAPLPHTGDAGTPQGPSTGLNGWEDAAIIAATALVALVLVRRRQRLQMH